MARQLTGIVSSTAADKTISVSISRRKTHPLYKKQFTLTKKIMAHDEKNEAKVGDKVLIEECRPLSRRKHFMLKRIVEKPLLREEELAATKADEPEKEEEDKPEAKDKK